MTLVRKQQQSYLASIVFTPLSLEKHLLCCQPSQSLLVSSMILNNLWDKKKKKKHTTHGPYSSQNLDMNNSQPSAADQWSQKDSEK